MRVVFLLIALLLSLPGCKTYHVSNTPVEVQAPDSLDPLPTADWEFVRTSAAGGVYLPRQQPVGKVKNSYNTDLSQKKSNNTKAKGEAIIGDSNAPIQAKKQAVVGDGNTVEQKSGWPWWVWVPLIGLMGIVYLCWKLRQL